MKELITNPWWSSIIVLATQFVFIYFRTINVIHTANKNTLKAVLSGNMIGIMWLISIGIGADAIMELKWQPILAYLIGGTIGTIVGLRK